MPTIMSAKSFVKKIHNVQGFKITLPDYAQKVILKNDSIITIKVPADWTESQFKEYCSKFVKIYTYDEEKRKKNERAILRDTEKRIQTEGNKGHKSRRKSLTLSSDEV